MKNLIRKILKEENADREKVSTILNTIFSPLNDGSQFISINHIPFTFQYYSKGIGKTEEEIVEEFINLTPLQLYERTKLYEKEFRRSKYNL